jgi:hypothetical protein
MKYEGCLDLFAQLFAMTMGVVIPISLVVLLTFFLFWLWDRREK